MKILIGEDEILIAEHIKDILFSYGYKDVMMAHSKEKIIELIDESSPDIALLDIRMEGKHDGINIGEYIAQHHRFPIVYITSHSTQDVVKEALKTKPGGYVIKPFQPIDIFTAVQIALDNHKDREMVFVFKNNHEKVRLPYGNILFLEADNNYVEIVAKNKKYVQRASLSALLTKLDSREIVQVHRSYAVNVNNIEKIYYNRLIIKGVTIPVSRKFKESLRDQLNEK